MNIGDKVEVIGHTKGGGQQFYVGEIVEIVRIGSNGKIKCSNGGNEQWWLDESEYKRCNQFDIHSLHGAYFIASICFDEVVGRVSIKPDGRVYLCQDKLDASELCREFFGYKYAWPVDDISKPEDSHVYDLKILPSPLEYHELFQEILAKRGPTWSEDGSYSVIPNEVMDKIRDFVKGIKILGKN